jgi:uncharacterized protein
MGKQRHGIRKPQTRVIQTHNLSLGHLYENGWGVELNVTQAKVWYQKAADQGSVFAQIALGRLQGNVPTAQAQDNTRIGQDYTVSAGDQYENGERYSYGREVKQDYARAKSWYQKAADQGHSDAQFMLGQLYENGWGVELNMTQAKVWYQKAADQGNVFAKTALRRF